ncbi:MAG: choice-of-anchor N protein [Candidatus Krumholzibacteriota bacterium]|nr:choice-of-anchor N protein [Candidatus Krumholzibacteriota bacterium]
MKRFHVFTAAMLAAVLFAGSAVAVPRIQTYITDSRYENFHSILDQRSWITNSQEFDLHVVGYWGEVNRDAINSGIDYCYPTRDYMECYVAISVPICQSGTIWINGEEISTFYNFGDAVPPGADPAWYLRWAPPATFGKFNFYKAGVIDNSQPNAWHYDHGLIHSPGWGDEKILDVVVKGFSWTHFDAIGIDARGVTYTNPWDYDATYFYSTPEPGTLSLLGLGLLGIAPLLRRKNKS